MQFFLQRHRLVQWLMAALMALALVGCAKTESRGLKLEEFLGATDERLTCPFPKVRGNLQLAGMTVYGLDWLQQWHPGYSTKVNWQSDEPAGPLELSLRPAGKEGPAYHLQLPTVGPWSPALPGPGCWELTVKRGDRTDKIGLVVQKDRLLGLAGLPSESNSRSSVQWSDPKGMRQLMQALGKAKKMEVDFDRPWFPVFLVWELQDRSFLRFYPAHQGEPALLQVEAGLVTSNCQHSTQWWTTTLSRDLADTLQKKVELRAGEMPERTGECHPFVPET